MKTRLAARTALLATALGVSALPALAADAQEYPNRPIRLIVPFGPGGGSDYVGRLVGMKLTEQMGQQVVVDNRPGAASLVGTEMAARGAPDGYTLCLCDVGFVINPAYYKKTRYDPIKDFAPITVVAETPYIIVGHPKTKSLKDLVAAARAAPGKLSLGSAGHGSGTHFSGELFKLGAKINMIHVPYKSAGLSTADVASDQIAASMSTPPAAMPMVKAGRIRILAAAIPKRSALLPDVPTFDESGVPGVYMTNWYSVMAVGGTPQPIIKRLHTELTRALGTADMRKRLAVAALEPAPNTPEQFRKMIRSELQRLESIMKQAGIRAE